MHDESLRPLAYAKLHADRNGYGEQQARSAMYQEHASDIEVYERRAYLRGWIVSTFCWVSAASVVIAILHMNGYM